MSSHSLKVLLLHCESLAVALFSFMLLGFLLCVPTTTTVVFSTTTTSIGGGQSSPLNPRTLLRFSYELQICHWKLSDTYERGSLFPHHLSQQGFGVLMTQIKETTSTILLRHCTLRSHLFIQLFSPTMSLPEPPPALIRTQGHAMGQGWLASDRRKFYSPPAERNKQAILEILQQYCTTVTPTNDSQTAAADGGYHVLEVGSGSGQHVAHFARALPHVTFWPTEYPGFPSPKTAEPQKIDEILESIRAYTQGLSNVQEPVALDIREFQNVSLSPRRFHGVVCINTLHISSLDVARALFGACGQWLVRGGRLFLYGPCKFGNGPAVPESNAQFDQILQEVNPVFGIRNVLELDEFAARNHMKRVGTHERPSNNHVLVYEKE